MELAEFNWFQEGKTNISYNCLDRHLAEKGAQTALIFEPNDPKEEAQHISYTELHERVSQMANVLKANGIEKGDRVLVTTLTKKMAEEMDRYLSRIQIKSKYIHSDIDALERVEILRELRLGVIDVLVGVNLLREGLDLPEVSLVVVLDADKEGFLRNEKSLTQTSGRAARNVNGRVIFYADQITKSMRRTMDETDRRRAKQIKYNAEHNITPTTIIKSIEQVMAQTAVLDIKGFTLNNINIKTSDDLEMVTNASDEFKTIPQIEKAITQTKKQMEKFAKALDFMEAAKLRDEMFRLEAQLEKMKNA